MSYSVVSLGFHANFTHLFGYQNLAQPLWIPQWVDIHLEDPVSILLWSPTLRWSREGNWFSDGTLFFGAAIMHRRGKRERINLVSSALSSGNSFVRRTTQRVQLATGKFNTRERIPKIRFLPKFHSKNARKDMFLIYWRLEKLQRKDFSHRKYFQKGFAL